MLFLQIFSKFTFFLTCIMSVNSDLFTVNETSTIPGLQSHTFSNGTRNNRSKGIMKRCENIKDDFSDLKNNTIIKEEFCKNKKCITKCCVKNKVYHEGRCKPITFVRNLTGINHSFDYSDFDIFATNIRQMKIKSKKNLIKDYEFVRNRKVLKCGTPPVKEIKEEFKFLLLENTTIVAEKRNSFNKYPAYWNMEDFCLEYQVRNTKKNGEPRVYLIFLRYPRNEMNASESDGSFFIPRAIALLLSCFFLILVLIVYGLLRSLHNVFGMVLMAYVSSLNVTFLIKAINLILVDQKKIDVEICKPLTVVLYFAILSVFFWMNVMSFDIWWTHRGFINRQPIHRRGQLVKFGWYSLYAFGIPALMTIFAAVVDYVDFSDSDIIKFDFQNCLNNIEPYKIMVYIHIPIGILTASNCVFFLLNAYNIWKIMNDVANFNKKDDVTRNTNQYRFGLYLKLSLVMGISWILELLPLTGWMETVATLYNSSTGVAIFFIFVFKRKIFVMLCRRFNINNSFVERMRRKSSTPRTGTSVRSKNRRSSAEE